MRSQSDSYAAAGVDITAGYRAVELMKTHIARTLTAGVIGDVGGFGGLYCPDLSGMAERKFGDSGNQIVIEEFLEGPEVSVLSFTDGKTVKPMTDIEIAQACEMRRIGEVAAATGIAEEYLEPYGRYKAKISLRLLAENPRPDGKLILVTAITPTPAGEGKTTTTIGLADGLRLLGKNAVVALREPSLGPVFGLKGGAAGGGYAQVVPMRSAAANLWWRISPTPISAPIMRRAMRRDWGRRSSSAAGGRCSTTGTGSRSDRILIFPRSP